MRDDALRRDLTTRLGANASDCAVRAAATAVSAVMAGEGEAERAHAGGCVYDLYAHSNFSRLVVPLFVLLGFFVSGVLVLHLMKRRGLLKVHYNTDRQLELRVAEARLQTDNPLFALDERRRERKPSEDRRTFHGAKEG